MGHDFDHYILDCLRRLPRGGDALEGSARWWMLRQRVCETLSAASREWGRPAAAGQMRERRAADGQILDGAGAARGLLGRESGCR
jgi:hypothetical protein